MSESLDDRNHDISNKTKEEIIHELLVHQQELRIQNEELKNAQIELERSRDRYIDLYDFSPVGYVTLTSNAIIIEANLTSAIMFGVVRKNLLTHRFREFFAKNDFERWDSFFQEVLSSPHPHKCDILFTRYDKKQFMAHIEAVSEEDNGGNNQVRMAIIDITVQHEAILKNNLAKMKLQTLLDIYQQTALTDEEFLKFVLEKSLNVVQSKIGFIGLINEDETEMISHAWSPEAMASCSVDILPIHFPIVSAGVWAEAVRKRRPLIINDFMGDDNKKRELPKGHVPIARLISVPVIVGSRVVAIIAGANKIIPYDEEDEKILATLAHTAWELLHDRLSEQELKKTQDMLLKAQKIARIGNFHYNYQNNQLDLSEEVFQIFRMDSIKFTRTLEEIIPWFDPDSRERIQEIFLNENDISRRIEEEAHIVRSDGTPGWIHIILETLSKQQIIVGIEGTIQDITEQKQSRIDWERAFSQISHNLEVMAILNDEIRNPLSIIVAMADLEGSERYKDTIFKAVADIDKIIDKLDKGWLESEKIRSFLKTHYQM